MPALHGTMMQVPLTLEALVARAASEFSAVEIVSRRPDRSLARTTYGAVAARARRLGRALVGLGIGRGDAVATLMWNHAEHLEAYLGVPLSGAVLHTLNLRLHPDEIAFIARDAGDRVLLVDDVLMPLLAKVIAAGAQFERVFVVGATRAPAAPHATYEALLDGADEATPLPTLGEDDALGCCYTSGTTGRPKGVVYTHRSTILHALVSALPDSLGLSRRDTIMPVVPMFHVNAWGLPYTATFVGAKQVFPGPYLDAASLLDLLQRERVTCAAGVPTLWLGVRDALDAAPGAYSLRPGLRMIVGGAAAPEQLIRDFDRHGLTLLHAWGMTETSPIGLVARLPPELDDASDDVRYALRARQGVPPPLLEARARHDGVDVPHDGTTTGELEVRAPWVAARYAHADAPARWTPDGFFRTGDIVNVDEHGLVKLVDRVEDLIKSGGEWVASQEVEAALLAHPSVHEAAVIGVAHPRWGERPLAAIVFKPGARATDDELRAVLAGRFAKYCLPDAFVAVESIPRTSTGKYQKAELRARFKDWAW